MRLLATQTHFQVSNALNLEVIYHTLYLSRQNAHFPKAAVKEFWKLQSPEVFLSANNTSKIS